MSVQDMVSVLLIFLLADMVHITDICAWSTRQLTMESTPLDVLNKQILELQAKLKIAIDYKNAFYPSDSLQVDQLDKVASADTQIVVAPSVEAPKTANQNPEKAPLTIPEKVLHALREVGIGKTKDVANKLIKLYPEYAANHKKAAKDARLNVSALAIKGQIEVVDKGEGNSGYTYKVKE